MWSDHIPSYLTAWFEMRSHNSECSVIPYVPQLYRLKSQHQVQKPSKRNIRFSIARNPFLFPCTAYGFMCPWLLMVLSLPLATEHRTCEAIPFTDAALFLHSRWSTSFGQDTWLMRPCDMANFGQEEAIFNLSTSQNNYHVVTKYNHHSLDEKFPSQQWWPPTSSWILLS